MTLQNFIAQATSEAILLVIILSLPAILASLVVGVAVAIFSATTQIQESTLSFAPKMVVVYIVIAVSAGWLANLILNFTIKCFSSFQGIGL